jgi:hypothetical protein
MSEDPYTGLLLASFLDPDARSTVRRGILAGRSGVTSASSVDSLKGVLWPTRGIDLVAQFGHGADAAMLLVEHKRFMTPSNRPGYRSNPNADPPWQTDQVYAAMMTGNEPPSWLQGIPMCQTKTFVVLDAYGKSMERMFPDGEFNDRWLVTSYPQFGAVLRAGYEQGVRGLVPLLTALYAGS